MSFTTPRLFALIYILLGISSVCHCQYYEGSEEISQYRDHSQQVRPPVRHHQYPPGETQVQKYYNAPFEEVEDPETTVQYFGTVYNHKPVEISASTEIVHTGWTSYETRSSSSMESPYRGSQPSSPYRRYPPPSFGANSYGVDDDIPETTRRNNFRPSSGMRNDQRIQAEQQPCSVTQKRFRGDMQCYKTGIPAESPCGALMTYYPENGDTKSEFGDCYCAPNYGNVSRPLVLWEQHNRCYPLYHRGPCLYHNEWIILDRNEKPVCAPRSCPHDIYEEDNSHESHRFWFRYNGKCYKTGEFYPEFCSPEKSDWTVHFPLGSGVPECVKETPSVYIISIKTLVTTVKDFPCRPGYKKTQSGECRRTARFENEFDY